MTVETAPEDPAVARALAAPTRATILQHLRERGPSDVRDVAEAVGVHANVARGHLEVLVGAKLALVSWRRNVGGGRPAKVYEAAPVHVEKGTALVSDLLATVIEVAAPEPLTARRIAERAGESLARQIWDGDAELEFTEQVEYLMRALATVSGGVRILDRGENWVELDDLDCPFRSIASSHPELACSLDKALKEGMVRALGSEVFVEQVQSIAWGDPTCREVVRWQVG